MLFLAQQLIVSLLQVRWYLSGVSLMCPSFVINSCALTTTSDEHGQSNRRAIRATIRRSDPKCNAQGSAQADLDDISRGYPEMECSRDEV
jgi:hypothetical protein